MSKLNKRILQFKIEDVVSFKTLIETLSKIVSETTWTLHNTTDKNKFVGLEINTADPTRTVFVKVQIKNDEFDEFSCKKEKYQIGINLEKLNKTIKFVEKEDALLVYLEENDLQNLIIEVQRANTKGRKILKLALIDLEYEDKPIKKVDYEKIVSMTPAIYKKIFRELDDYQNVKINCGNKKIIFTYKDDTSDVIDEYVLGDDGIILENSSTKNEFIGIYPIKFLILFVKCSSLCDDLQIYMKNEFALTLVYSNPTFGKITVSLSPINEENIKNVEYDYSDDEDELDIIGNNVSKLYYD